MKQNNTILKLGLFLSITCITMVANDISNKVIPTKHNKDLTISQLAEIQPGLGSVMMEFGHRFYIAYYASKAGNWELAEYEIHELLEAQEVAEITRPKYTKKLKEFEYGAIKELQKAIKKKDWELFKTNYANTTNRCNSCHKDTGHPYIKYKLPREAPKFLEL